MKKSSKAIRALVLMLLMVVSLAATVFAASASITFDGFSKGFDLRPGSEYTQTDLFENFKNVMPGDTLTQTITFTNSAADCDFVHLYMRAEVHDEAKNPLSENVAAKETLVTMTDFLSKLSMKVWNGTELIYEASPDELDGLKNNVFLGTFRTGEKATLTVELHVPIELGSEYANRAGEVDWVFHVEAYNESQLTVRKLWSDGNASHASDSVTVNLLKDGVVDRSAVLNAANGWAYTFDRLTEGHTWTVEEASVPDGYTVSYSTEGTMVTITNTKIYNPPPTPPTPPTPPAPPTPVNPVDITVCKVWSGDEGKDRPDSVTVTLYDGETAYDTVRLGEWNNWRYSWKNLDGSGNWQVIESNIPKDYVPSYSVSGTVITITNTRSLIKTGQMNWPIWVLGGAGLALIALGGAMLARKKKQDHAE